MSILATCIPVTLRDYSVSLPSIFFRSPLLFASRCYELSTEESRLWFQTQEQRQPSYLVGLWHLSQRSRSLPITKRLHLRCQYPSSCCCCSQLFSDQPYSHESARSGSPSKLSVHKCRSTNIAYATAWWTTSRVSSPTAY